MDSSKDKSENLLIEANRHKLSEYLKQIKIEAQKTNELLEQTKKELSDTIVHNNKLSNILQHTFMYRTYKSLNPDLKNLDNKSLLDHYVSFGFEEGRKCDEKSAADIEMDKHTYQFTRVVQELARGYLQENKPQGLNKQVNASETNDHCRKITKTIGTRISLDENKDFKFALEHTLYEPTRKCLATFIPKNGCTNLRYSFALANNLISGSEDIDWIHSNNQSMNANLENIQNSEYTFVILRNPYERLASAFWDKFVTGTNDCYSNEKSKEIFQSILKTNKDENSINSFKDFVNTLWENPLLISKETHLRYQTDYLLLANYNDYFTLKEFKALQKKVLEESNLIITDTRDITKHTTYGYTYTDDSSYSCCTLKELNSIKSRDMVIKYDNFYDEEDSYKVTLLYLNDIVTYIEKIKDLNSTRDYLRKALTYSTNYQI
jgi:hypothetical protein